MEVELVSYVKHTDLYSHFFTFSIFWATMVFFLLGIFIFNHVLVVLFSCCPLNYHIYTTSCCLIPLILFGSIVSWPWLIFYFVPSASPSGHPTFICQSHQGPKFNICVLRLVSSKHSIVVHFPNSCLLKF